MAIALRLLRDERGVATVEYLVLLAVLVGGAVAAVVGVALGISGAFESWNGFFESLVWP